MLVDALRRYVPFDKWSCDVAAPGREDFLRHAEASVRERFGNSAGAQIHAVADLLRIVERGYSDLRETQANSRSGALNSVDRVAAILARAGLALAEVHRLLTANVNTGALDLLGISVPDPAGRPMQPDVPVDVIIHQTAHALRVEAYASSWFDAWNRVVIPGLSPANHDLVVLVQDVAATASAWRE